MFNWYKKLQQYMDKHAHENVLKTHQQVINSADKARSTIETRKQKELDQAAHEYRQKLHNINYKYELEDRHIHYSRLIHEQDLQHLQK